MARVVDTPVLSLTGRLFREGSAWVADCPEFDVATHDSSAEGARGALREAVAAFLESCVNRRTLRSVLKGEGSARNPTASDRSTRRSATGSHQLRS